MGVSSENHDMRHMGYSWGRCSGFNYRVAKGMPKEMELKEREE